MNLEQKEKFFRAMLKDHQTNLTVYKIIDNALKILAYAQSLENLVKKQNNNLEPIRQANESLAKNNQILRAELKTLKKVFCHYLKISEQDMEEILKLWEKNDVKAKTIS